MKCDVMGRSGTRQRLQGSGAPITEHCIGSYGYFVRKYSGSDALVMSEAKIRGNKTIGRPNRIWLNYVKQVDPG